MTSEVREPATLADQSATGLIEAAERAKAAGGPLSAVEVYEAWLGLHGDDPLVHAIYFNLGVSYNEVGAPLKAARAFRDGLRANPDFTSLRINLGRTLEIVGDPNGAVEQWRKGVERIGVFDGEAVSNKGVLLTQSARLLQQYTRDEHAAALLEQAIDLEPHHEAAVRDLIGLRSRQCLWPALRPTRRVSVERQRGFVWPLSLAALADDPLFQLARASKHNRDEFARPTRAEMESVAAARPTRNTRARIKIGYVSSDLREHAVGLGMTEVFETHDRARFETFAYYCGIEREDPVRQRIRAAAEHWRDISAASDLDAARAIARDGIDILVDLNGYTKFARTRIFALRPAPVQVNWFGYPATMGTPYHHYLIADETIVPRGSEIFYSEEVLRLPCYQPNDRRRPIASQPRRADFGLPEHGFVFCSFNATQKLTQRTFDLWLAILNAAPSSVLWMLEGGAGVDTRLAAYARDTGIDPARIIVAPKLPNSEHLARYPLADLFLDSFPWGAHTTASDALWMGTPVLTRTGRSFAARVCSSLVKAAGLPEFACDSEGEYASKAVAFATRPDLLAPFKAKLREGRETCLLFDVERLVRALEGLYLEMTQREAKGRTPRPQLGNLDVYHEIGTRLDFETVNALPREAYLQLWRDALAEYDLHMPLTEDGRLWAGAHPTLAARRTAAG
jgi:predicted O-linked N-acetylglucosamine transferase (SPINDLY family)